MFSCEFYEISKNTFSYRTPPVAASIMSWKSIYFKDLVSMGFDQDGVITIDELEEAFAKVTLNFNLNCFHNPLVYLILMQNWGRYTYDVHENCPIFKTPHHPCPVQLRPKFFHTLDLWCPLSKEFPPPPSPNDNQSVKRKRNPRMAIICYHVFPSGRLSFSVSTQ